MARCLCLLLLVVSCEVFALSSQNGDYLILLVNARQLDYSSEANLFKTMSKHPSDYSKNGDVGHAWIYLSGQHNGESVRIEGGQSGELGCIRPKYFEGVMNYNKCGYFDPTEEEMLNPRYEPNPIKYLWASSKDGFFQEGCGGHVPTYAIKINITHDQYLDILRFMHPSNYDYKEYSITKNQCSSYVASIAAIAGVYLEDKVTMKISPSIQVFGENVRLWTDIQYSTLTFSSPDVLEKSMKRAVREGLAEDVTRWYKKNHPKTSKEVVKEWQDSFCKMPERWFRASFFFFR